LIDLTLVIVLIKKLIVDSRHHNIVHQEHKTTVLVFVIFINNEHNKQCSLARFNATVSALPGSTSRQ